MFVKYDISVIRDGVVIEFYFYLINLWIFIIYREMSVIYLFCNVLKIIFVKVLEIFGIDFIFFNVVDFIFCMLFKYFNNVWWCLVLMFIMVFNLFLVKVFWCFLWCFVMVWLCDLLWMCWIKCNVGLLGGRWIFLFYLLINKVFKFVLCLIFFVILIKSGFDLFYDIFKLVKVFNVWFSCFLLLLIKIIFGIFFGLSGLL